ncbi:MAG TPA: Crp/Fnr family transcriptional regulator [Anaerolineales bacterium]|nr:Crp/Fnr family transcriptional regulator [Anaerolineales bacterium]
MSLYSNIHKNRGDPEAFLAGNALFEALDDSQRRDAAGTLQWRKFAAGVTLFHQDMPGMMLYMIETGCVRVFSLGRTGQELTFEIFGPNDILGELSILDDKHHTATAITILPSVIWLMPKPAVDALLNSDPRFAQAMIRILVKRLRARAQYAEAMTFQDVQGRVAYALLNLADRFGVAGEGGLEIDIPLTQVDLGSIIGVTRESVNKALAALRTMDLVHLEGSRLFIIDRGGLQKMIQDRGR